jgi:hypothetical protein
LLDGQFSENIVSLGHKANTVSHIQVNLPRLNGLVLVLNLSFNLRKITHHALEQGGFACAIVAKNSDALSILNAQRQIMQDLQFSVISVDVIDLKHLGLSFWLIVAYAPKYKSAKV